MITLQYEELSMVKFLKLYFFEMLLVWGALGGYYLLPFAEFVYTEKEGFYFNEGITVETLFYLTCVYSVVAIYLMSNLSSKDADSKLVFLLKNLFDSSKRKDVKTILQFFMVKLFFIPLMIPGTIYYSWKSYEIFMHAPQAYASFIHYFNGFIFPLGVHIIASLALAFYSFGYLVESEYLKSKVKSVDSSFLGWFVTLICYVPFFTLAIWLIPFHSKDMEFFINYEITFIARIGLLMVMLFKLWSIATLGAKCSNLTNRGIVTKGPYKWIRHPHYLAKLIVWWVTFMPVFIHNYWTIGAMFFWTMVYVLRALTEENHLGSDEEYKAYCKNVKWRFIPFVY